MKDIVRNVMTEDPTCCTPDTSLQNCAMLMEQKNCGEIPVVDNLSTKHLLGVITDRDIAIRAVAKGLNTSQALVRDCMSSPAVSIGPDASLQECFDLMSLKQIRRLPVVDEKGVCCGIVAQADIARVARREDVGDIVREVSKAS